MVSDSAPAEFGRSSGGFINVVTKSGTNALHGTLHEYQKWTGLTSRLSDGTRLSGFAQEQFGGTLGGAIKKDKLFYFAGLRPAVFHPDQAEQSEPHRSHARRLFRLQIPGPQRERSHHPRKQRHRHAGQDRLVRQSQKSLHRPLQFRPRPPAQRHLRRGTMGPQRQRHRARFFQYHQPPIEYHYLRPHAQRSALSILPRRPPARLHRPQPPRPEPPPPGYRHRFRRPVPFRPTVLHSDEGPRHAVPGERQRVSDSRRPQLQVRRRNQPHRPPPRPSSASPMAATFSTACRAS